MSQWVPPMAHYRATLRSLCGVWCAVCCCDRRSPLTLATTMFCRDRDRDRPTATDRPCQTFPFEENAGFAFVPERRRFHVNQTSYFALFFKFGTTSYERRRFFKFVCKFGTTISERRLFLLGEVGSDCPKRGGKFSGCHLPGGAFAS